MSAIVLYFNRDGRPIHEAAFRESMRRLARWGPDGDDAWVDAHRALGHQHFWITPEEVGERQPIHDDRYVIAFVGRLDNRADVIRDLDLDDRRERSDAALVLRAYQRWGDGCFAKMIGAFVAVIVDRAANTITLARDALGDFTLFYALNERMLIAASEVHAILAHPDVRADLNERSVIAWYAARSPAEGETLFAAAGELPAATIMTISPDTATTTHYWQPQIAPIRYRHDAEYGEHFRALLEEAVRCRLRSIEPPVLMMSGGYDSTAIAAIMAGLRVSPLRTVSWTFDTLTESDERRYIEAMIAAFDLEATMLRGDDLTPLTDMGAWPFNPNRPDANPYRMLQVSAYAAAKQAGARVVMTGWFGNHLYVGGYDWLAETLAAGRVFKAADGLRRMIARWGVRHPYTARSLLRIRRLAGKALRRRLGVSPRPPQKRHWMMQDAFFEPSIDIRGMRSDQLEALMGAASAYDASNGRFFAANAGLHVWMPYRDRRLAEFMLAIPAEQLFNGERQKWIMYQAFEGVLPEVVRQRADFTRLLAVYRKGLREGAALLHETLDAPDALWRRYVKAEALAEALRNADRGEDAEVIVPWLCFAMEWWINRRLIE